jgi:hypothetical protein
MKLAVLVLLFPSLCAFAQDRNAFIYDGTQTSRMGAIDIISLNEIVNRYEQLVTRPSKTTKTIGKTSLQSINQIDDVL